MSDFVIENGILKKYTGAGGDVVIPDGITEIGEKAFGGCAGLTSITIPDSVTKIGESAFRGCTELTGVYIHDLKKWCEIQFDGWLFHPLEYAHHLYVDGKLVTDLVISDGIISIKDFAFSGCTDLTSITISDSVTEIGKRAFCGCEGLTEITIPNGVRKIEEEAFQLCCCLEKVSLPVKLKSIKNGVFSQCYALKNISIPTTVTDIGSRAFEDCRNLEAISFPDGLQHIESFAFRNCERIEEVVLPSGLKKIGERAFEGCSALNGVMTENHNVPVKISSSGSNTDTRKCLVLRSQGNIVRFDMKRVGGNVLIYVNGKDIENGIYIPEFLINKCRCRSAADLVSVLLYGISENWETCIAKSNILPSKVVKSFCNLMQSNQDYLPEAYQSITTYVKKFYKKIDSSFIDRLYNAIAAKNPEQADLFAQTLHLDFNTKKKPEHEIEKYVQEYLYGKNSTITVSPRIVKDITSGVPYADGSGTSSVSAVVAIIAAYENSFMEHSNLNGSVKTLECIPNIIPEADHIASALNRDKLAKELYDNFDGKNYRSYLLAFLRYATEKEITKLIEKLKSALHGDRSDKIWAENVENAMYLNDSLQVGHYIHAHGNLKVYAEMRGYTETEYRDSKLISDFGFDENGIKHFDIGGDTIDVSVGEDLKLCLYDTGKGKTIRSFPKTGEDAKALKKATESYLAFKKQADDFIEERKSILASMYWTGETISDSVFQKLYLNHPILKVLASLLVWMDEKGRTFTVYENQIVNSDNMPYQPSGAVSLAHVLDIGQTVVDAWQKFLTDRHQKQLFAQMWEPKIISQISSDILKTRYDGAVITEKERNEFKKVMKAKNIDVRSSGVGKWFNYETYTYEFENNATLYIGNAIGLDYIVDADAKELHLGELSFKPYKDERILNATLYVLDLIVIRHQVVQDRYDVVQEDRLQYFTAAQIEELLKCAIKSNAVNCTAALMEYKNQHFGFDTSFDEFTLEW